MHEISKIFGSDLMLYEKKEKVQSHDLFLFQANCRKLECKFCNL